MVYYESVDGIHGSVDGMEYTGMAQILHSNCFFKETNDNLIKLLGFLFRYFGVNLRNHHMFEMY